MALTQHSSQKVMSFAEIVQGRDATVRVTHDGFLYAVDLVMVMTGKFCNLFVNKHVLKNQFMINTP